MQILGADKLKGGLPQPPKMRFRWDEKPLTNKEAEDLLPKVKGMISFIFKNFDQIISITNKERAQANIWKAIDDEDVTIIAQHLVDMAKESKVVATAVRKMSNSFRLLQINMITLPRFVQTFQFYQQHGGFALLPARLPDAAR